MGERDVFLSKYDASGTLLWTRQLGTELADIGRAVAVDTNGNVYITGSTGGDLGGVNAGASDAFLTKYVVPEPATLSLLALGGLALIRRRRSKRKGR